MCIFISSVFLLWMLNEFHNSFFNNNKVGIFCSETFSKKNLAAPIKLRAFFGIS